ncbi:MAG: hypothetical protein QNJ98_10790 [Planctomycetota bacterium]|nr:hypothetical protein [Planctomycetota bacterium]
MRSLPVVLVALLFAGTAAFAEPVEDPTYAAARKVRAQLPSPSPAARLAYEGDLVIDTLWAGEVTYGARAKKFGGESVWNATEDVFIDVGGAELHFKAAYSLSKDLALRSGSASCKHRGTEVSVFFARKDKGITLMRTVKPPTGASQTEQLVIEAPADATYGRVAVLLFLRGVDREKASDEGPYALPWFPLFEHTTAPALRRGEGKAPAPPTAVNLFARGQRPSKHEKDGKDWLVDAERGEQTVRLRLDPSTKALRRTEGGSGRLSVVPRGEGGERIQTDEEKPATTWKQAFLKFGFGYHMARKALIEEAFHWPSMYAYETEVAKSWDKAKPVEAFKAAWVNEFLTQSMRRTRAATERLLSMTLGTGTVKEETKDTVVFAAHANFGGGVQRTYHLKKVDGLWYLWRVDF